LVGVLRKKRLLRSALQRTPVSVRGAKKIKPSLSEIRIEKEMGLSGAHFFFAKTLNLYR
jgi:hypothetical protein